MFKGVDDICKTIHQGNVDAGWWCDLETGEDLRDNVYFQVTKLGLIHSEVSEAMEGLRKSSMDDKLPEYPMEAVELADVLIRVFDYCGAKGYPMEEILTKKVNFNSNRPDHNTDNRRKVNGKLF